MTTRRAVFLDLNGTLVLPLKPDALDELTWIPGAVEAVRRLTAAGFVCPVVTGQARIEKGLFSEEAFRAWFAGFFGRAGLDVEGPWVCPHRESRECPCGKPSPLLYERAAQQLSLDLPRAYVIGDAPQDVEAAQRVGGTGCLVRTGWAADAGILEAARPHAAFVGDTIAEAVDWILTTGRGAERHAGRNTGRNAGRSTGQSTGRGTTEREGEATA